MVVSRDKDPFRVKPWRSDTYKGTTRHKRFFATKEEAEVYDAQQTLSPVSKSGWNKIKVKSLLERYRDEIVPTLAGYKKDNPEKDNTTYRLNYMINNNPGKKLSGYNLSDLVEQVQGWEYVRARQKQVTMRTVSKERNILQRVFATAAKEWGYLGLPNPFGGMKLKGSKFKRTRRLEEGEYERLIEQCKKCHGMNKRYVPLAIDIAVETAMREQEVFNLQWRDINFERRTIRVRKSKMDYTQDAPGRTIVLPYLTLCDLVGLKSDLEEVNTEVKKTQRIFPMTQDALIQAFERVVESAGIEDLIYPDLRREATSRWGDKEPPLTVPQMKLMDGHAQSDNDINSTYNVPALKEIRRKLDIHVLGMMFEEKYKNALNQGMSVYEIVYRQHQHYWGDATVFSSKKEFDKFQRSLDDINKPSQPPSEEQKQTKEWKLHRYHMEIYKSGLLPIVDSKDYGDSKSEQARYQGDIERREQKRQQLFNNPTYEQLDRLKRIYQDVFGDEALKPEIQPTYGQIEWKRIGE
jgi:integrase